MNTSDEALGRWMVQSGQLPELRKQLGVSRSTMSELLHISPYTYRRWETDRTVQVTMKLAERLGAFCRMTLEELKILEEDGVTINRLMPIYMLAVQLGLPQEMIMKKYRDGEIPAEDLGILGLWVRREDW